MFAKVTDRLAVGDEAELEQLKAISAQGFQVMVDLCTEAEGRKLPEEVAQQAGLRYFHLPVAAQNLSSELLGEYESILAEQPGSVYTRCSGAKRASLMTLLAIGRSRGWSQEEFMQHLSELAITLPPALLNFAADQLPAETDR